jgi:predicted ferric reductase
MIFIILYSSHGQLGYITYMYMLLQFTLGVLVAYVPSLFGGATRAKGMYKYHRVSGYVLVMLLWITTLYGVFKPFVLPTSKFPWVYYASTALVFAGLLYRIQSSKLGFSKSRRRTGL